jgi:hypothetical protein
MRRSDGPGIDIGMIDVAVRKIFITPRTWITVRSGVCTVRRLLLRLSGTDHLIGCGADDCVTAGGG